MVKTINSLPGTYTGTCHIVLNSLTSYVQGRTIMSLILLLAAGPVEETSELLVHFLYSAALTPGMYQAISKTAQKYFRTSPNFDVNIEAKGGNSIMNAVADGLTLNEICEQIDTTYDLAAATMARQRITLKDDRADYREHYLMKLRPSHRLGFVKYRSTGILLPFAVPDAHFTQPNR
jgi:hypothetical protein